MPNFLAQTKPPATATTPIRMRACLVGRITAGGQTITVTRPNDNVALADYTLKVPAIVERVGQDPATFSIEGIVNVENPDPYRFTFEGGYDVQERDIINYGGYDRRIYRVERQYVFGVEVKLDAFTIREG